MKYSKVISLKDGRKCVIRNGIKEDAEGALNNYILTHGETDWLFSYPDEINLTSEKEALYLEGKTNSSDEIELIAEVGGKIVGLAGIDRIGEQDKVRHRCENLFITFMSRMLCTLSFPSSSISLKSCG